MHGSTRGESGIIEAGTNRDRLPRSLDGESYTDIARENKRLMNTDTDKQPRSFGACPRVLNADFV